MHDMDQVCGLSKHVYNRIRDGKAQVERLRVLEQRKLWKFDENCACTF